MNHLSLFQFDQHYTTNTYMVVDALAKHGLSLDLHSNVFIGKNKNKKKIQMFFMLFLIFFPILF